MATKKKVTKKTVTKKKPTTKKGNAAVRSEASKKGWITRRKNTKKSKK